MNKFAISVATITILIIGTGIFLFTRQSGETVKPSTPNGYEYFWGEGCPHCANVEEFINTWDKKDQIELTKYEVYKSPANANLMSKRVTSCGMNYNEVGIPFLFTPDGKCIAGDTPIIDHFKGLYNLPIQTSEPEDKKEEEPRL